jgi:hypothetical protein
MAHSLWNLGTGKSRREPGVLGCPSQATRLSVIGVTALCERSQSTM